MATLTKAEVKRQIRMLSDKANGPGLTDTERSDFNKLCDLSEAFGRAEAQPKRSTATDLPTITGEIHRLARINRTPAENARFYALCRQSKSMHEANRAAEARAAKRSARTAPAPKVTAPARDAGFTRAPVERVIDPTSATRTELRDGALKVLERESNRLTPGQLDHVEVLVRESTDNRDAATVARWVAMTETPAYRSAFWKSLRDERPAYTATETYTINRFRETFVSEFRAGAEVGSFGLAIPATIDPSIVPSAGELAPIVQLCTRVPVMTDVWKGVASTGSPWTFQAEGATVADESPTLVQPVLPINTARTFVPASIELSEDYPNWTAELTKTLDRGYVDLLAQKSAVGSGTGEPTGLFTRMANTTTNPSHVTVTTAGHIGAIDVRAAWSALPQRFRASATWVCHENVLSQVRNIAGAASQVDLVVDRQGTTLMGRPVVTSSYCPDFTGTTGAESFLVLGDLSGYTLATRLGVTVELVPQMRDGSGRPIGERGYLAYARVGADVTVPTAMALLANS